MTLGALLMLSVPTWAQVIDESGKFQFDEKSVDGAATGWQFRGMFYLANESYKYGGGGVSGSSGLNVNISNTRADSYGAEVLRRSPGGGWLGGYLFTTARHTPPATNTAANVTVTTNRFYFEKRSHLIEDVDGTTWYLGYGLETQARSATSSSPAILVPSTRHSFRFSTGYLSSFNKDFGYDFGLGLTIPFFFDEAEQKSGYYQYAYVADLRPQLVYYVNPLIHFSFGVRYIMEFSKFRGDGTRTTSNAEETYTHLLFPIELRFNF